jgi:hypothetical protein
VENPFEEKPPRSTFLTVLCTLTFIGSGWSVLSNTFSLITHDIDKLVRQVEITSRLMEQGGTWWSYMLSSSVEVLLVMAEHGKEILAFSLLLNLLSLAGAFEMFRLRRRGLLLYAVAQLLAPFILPCYAGFSWIVTAGFSLSVLFSLVFILLYASHLRQMR